MKRESNREKHILEGHLGMELHYDGHWRETFHTKYILFMFFLAVPH